MERQLDRTSDVYHGEVGNPVYRQHHRQRIHWMAAQARGRVLDVGCSQGIVSLLLAREGHEVVGVDIEPEVIEQARQALAREPAGVQERVQFVVADFLAGEMDLGQFDTVMAGEILEHLVQPEELVRRCAEALKPGGLFVVTVPFGVHPFPDHKHTFYLRSLAQTLAPHFSLEQVELLHVPGGADAPVPIIGAVAKKLARPARRAAGRSAQAAQWLEFSEQGFAVTEARYVAQLDSLRNQGENLRKRAETSAADLRAARGRVSELEKETAQVRLERDQQAGALSTLLEMAGETAGRVAKLLGVPMPTVGAKDDLGKRATAMAMTAQATAVAVGHLAAERARLAEESGRVSKERDELRVSVAGLQQAAKAQADLEKELRRQLSELQQQSRAQAEAERELRQQLGELQQQSRAQAETERELRGRLEAQSKAAQKLAEQLASVQKEAATRTKAEQALGGQLGLAQADLAAFAEADRQLRLICRERDRAIRQLRWKLGMMEDSTSYRVGLLIVRSLRRPYRLLTMPFSAVKLLIGDALANRRKGKAAARAGEEGRLADLPTPLTEAPPPVKRKAPSAPGADVARTAAMAMPVSQVPAVPLASGPGTPAPQEDEKTRLLLSGLYEQPRRVQDLKIAVIMDEFSLECFRPDCQIITFRPDNWRPILERERPHFLLVESAWKGNGGSWEYRIGTYNRTYPRGREELTQLVGECRRRGIPSAFWGKEDPVHFSRFVEAAKLFDFVFTTDANCIPAYRKAVGHDRVYALPFAAQPRLHNPVRVPGYRRGSVCFAGSYYPNRHPQRREEMEWLLDAAMPLGLEIYDRGYGRSGSGAEQFTFPERFGPAIRGGLPYKDVVKAYKQYRVFLNVNSVADSPTMFSRRVFELLACGTPVVSTPAQGIQELLGRDAVQLVSTPEEAESALRRLLADEAWRERIGLAGQRLIAAKHTYAHRLAEVANRLGYQIASPEPPRFSLITWTNGAESLSDVVARIVAQNGVLADVVVVSPDDGEDAKRLAEQSGLGDRLVALKAADPADGASWWREALAEASGDYIALLSPDDHHGESYLSDLMRAIAYTDADAVGKATHYARDGDNGAVELIGDGQEYGFVESVAPAAMVARRELLAAVGWPGERLHDRDALRGMATAGARIFSADRFNYVRAYDARLSGAPLEGVDI